MQYKVYVTLRLSSSVNTANPSKSNKTDTMHLSDKWESIFHDVVCTTINSYT
jgi:hypothetical protein